MLWNIIITILLGALAGWLAGLIMKVRGSGFWLCCILGVAGSSVGRMFASVLGISARQVSVGGIAISVAGACIVVWAVRKIMGGKKS